MKKINLQVLKYILLIIIGIYCLLLPTAYLQTFHIFSYLSVLILAFYFLFKNIQEKKIDIQAIINIIVSVVLFIIIKQFPNIYITLLPIILGIYIFLIGLVKLLTLFIYKKLPESRLNLIVSTVLHLTFSFLFIVFPTKSIKGITILIGLYLIILGIEKIYNYYSQNNYLNILKLPSILISTRPYRTFLKLKGKKFTNTKNLSDVEVLIHVRDSRRGMFGHADLIYRGYVYSYGNYDNSTYKIFDAIGEGVLFKANKEQYINFCKKHGKTLFCFGLKLNEKEMNELDNRFNKIMNNTYEWDKENIVKGSYAEKLNKNVDIRFYKFNEGYYQNYFFLNYNCVKYIEEVISPEILDFSSITTPGILYNYLENERHKKNSSVAYRNIL